MQKSIDETDWNINSHAYIFLGPDITTTSKAKFVAKKALCENMGAAPCGTCVTCLKISRDTHPDVVEVFPTGASIKIDQVRRLILNFAEKPLEGRKQVFIIHNADTMTPQAQNALLKTLEEPMGESICILILDNLKKLLPTVISRCQIFNFSESIKSPIAQEIRESVANIVTLNVRQKGSTEIGSLVRQLSQGEEKAVDVLEYISSLYRDILVVKTKSVSSLINADLKHIIEEAADVLPEVSIVKALDHIHSQLRAAKSKGNANLIWYNLLVGLEEVV